VAAVARFEDLDAWKVARVLTAAVYRVTSGERFRSDPDLRSQLRRASVSIVSNIAEGFERGGNAEFRQFLSQAKGSAGEVRAQLYIAADVGLLDPDAAAELHGLVIRTSSLIAGLMRHLSDSTYRGSKHLAIREESAPLNFER
jgi:four helix bundle protein